MAHKQTLVLDPDAEGVDRAAAILREGGLVAFPTETVYGLGANALDASTVAAIFAAKGRPSNDPLIIHLADMSQLRRVARRVPRTALALARAFWPGPLTLVLPKQPTVPGEATAGLATVAVRIPAHPVAHALIVAADMPVAAPSANLFSRPSPTRAEHVLADLGGRLDAVLDGGPTPMGVESTIIDLTVRPPRLLRPGGIAAEAIEQVLGFPLGDARAVPDSGAQRAPGQLSQHYAPRTPLTLFVGQPDSARAALLALAHDQIAAGKRVGLLIPQEDLVDAPPEAHVGALGSWQDPAATAAVLFHAMRRLDASGLDVILARVPANPQIGLGRAIADRLRRAAFEVRIAPT